MKEGWGNWKSFLRKIFIVLSLLYVFVHIQSQSRDITTPFRFESLHWDEVSEGSYHLIILGTCLFTQIFVELFINPEDDPNLPHEQRRRRMMRMVRFMMG